MKIVFIFRGAMLINNEKMNIATAKCTKQNIVSHLAIHIEFSRYLDNSMLTLQKNKNTAQRKNVKHA